MSTKKKPNEAQSDKPRTEIPKGIGYGKFEDNTYKTIKEMADSMDTEETKNKNR